MRWIFKASFTVLLPPCCSLSMTITSFFSSLLWRPNFILAWLLLPSTGSRTDENTDVHFLEIKFVRFAGALWINERVLTFVLNFKFFYVQRILFFFFSGSAVRCDCFSGSCGCLRESWLDGRASARDLFRPGSMWVFTTIYKEGSTFKPQICAKQVYRPILLS